MEAPRTFEHLLDPIQVGSLTARNRMVMPPMGTDLASPDGFITQKSLDYYEARAAGGVGLLCVEVGCVDLPRGRAIRRQIGIDDDKFVPGLAELAGVIRQHGASAMIQLHHAGREAHIQGLGIQPVGPSSIRSIIPKALEPRPLTVEEIQEMVARFVDGAARARSAGFDGVELHAAHTYLFGQFLSPLCNDRSDQYGGSVPNRARFLLEVVRGIKLRSGRDFPLVVRLSAEEPVPGGVTVEDTCQVVQMLEQAGADCISVSTGGHVVPMPIVQAPASYPPGYMLHLPERIKQVVRLPVIGVGRLNTPAVAEAALRDGKCDLVALGRALIVDPEFPNKVMQGRPEDIRPCTACMYCLDVALKDLDFACANNPAAGREREMAVRRTTVRKKVVVLGGGIAGMEAARTAALRGHNVTMFERSDRLGGQLVPAAVPPHKQDLNLLRNYYVAQIEKTGVATKLGQAANIDAIVAEDPDVVIVATGSRPRLPEIRGIDRLNVVLAEDVLIGAAPTGQRVVVIGGELVGCETAEFLAAQGKTVTIVRRSETRLAAGMGPVGRRQLLDRLAELRVESLNGVRYEEINERGIVVTTLGGSHELLEADTIVVAAGSAASIDLAAELRTRVPVVEVIGDAVQPRRFVEAIKEGMAVGLTV